jgi:hypothetical protein
VSGAQEEELFLHKLLKAREIYRRKNTDFELAIYRTQEDGHYSGYLSAGGFSDLIVEISDIVASDFQTTTGGDPVSMLLETIKAEIDAGKFDLAVAIQKAIARIRSLLAPAQGFTSGNKIYEPEPGDPQASLKHEITAFAVKTVCSFERATLPARTELTVLQRKVDEYQIRVDSDIDEPEKQDNSALLAAIEQLISVAVQHRG